MSRTHNQLRRSCMQFKPVFVDKSYRVKLDFENLDVPERKIIEPWLIWQTRTYKKLDKDGGDPTIWNALFGASNWVLTQLNDEQLVTFAKAFATMQRMVIERMPVDGNRREEDQLLKELGAFFMSLVFELDLINLFDKYSHQFIKMDDTTEVGTRPQDTAELTFHPPEMRRLIVVALLCKLLIPIFGGLMSKMPNIVGEDGKEHQPFDREMRCAVIMKPLLEHSFKDLMIKFQHYLQHTVRGCCGQENPAAVFSGFTISTRTTSIYANLLVRNFINIDLCYDDSNIMRFCDSIARTLVGTQDSSANKNQVKTRIPFGAAAGSDDVGNVAQLEVDSVPTAKTMDIPMIVSVAVEPTIYKYCMMFDIAKDEFNACYEYFLKHPIYPTPINKFVAGSFFARDFGGGRGVQYLQAPEYTRIICLLQMIVFSQGFKEFGHILTAQPALTARTQETQEDTLLRLNYGNSFAYRNVKQKIELSPASSNGREWDQEVEEIVADLVGKIYVYNTPTYLWDLMGEEELNGKRIVNDPNMITGMCIFVEKALQSSDGEVH